MTKADSATREGFTWSQGHLVRPLRSYSETMSGAFTEVKHVKPKASRSDSSELYLVATGFKRRAD